MEPIHDRVVFVTGTSSGFGLLASVRLATDGYQVVASMRDTNKRGRLEELASTWGVTNRISIVEVDVANEYQVESVIRDTIQRYGRIDVLINNAGIGGHGFIEEIPSAEWRRTFDINFFGALACIRTVLPHMRTRHSGTIINIGSVAGRIAAPGAGPYSPSKFALEAVSESLRLEMAPFGVKVCIIEPAAFKTDIWNKAEDFLFFNDGSPYLNGIDGLRSWASSEAENAADPMDVVGLIREILGSDAPTLRYPIGTIAGQTAEDVIRGYLSTPWEEIERR